MPYNTQLPQKHLIKSKIVFLKTSQEYIVSWN